MDTELKPEETTVETPAHGQPKKKSFMRRMLKVLLWVFVFIFVALLALPLWINPVATSLAGLLVPSYTGTAFGVGRVNLNPYTGKLLVSDVKLANPEGYSEKEAFTLGSLSAEVEVMSLLSDTIHVREVTVDAPFASWVFDAEGSNNFDRIIASVNKKLGPKKEKKEKSETKVVVDKLTVTNVRVIIGVGAFELATLTLTDFGKDTPAKIEIAGVKLMNPEGFPEPNAFSLKSLNIGMETADLSKTPLVFHDILVDSPYAGYVFNEAGDNNLDLILKPFKGADEKDGKKDDAASDEKKKKDEAAGPRVVIDKLDISGTKLQYRMVTLPIPLPTLTDIGKDSKEGSTTKEVADMVVEKAKSAAGGLADFAGAFGSGATNMLGNAKDAITAGTTNVLGSAKDLVSGGATNMLGGAKKTLGNAVDTTKGLIGGLLPGGDKKDDDEKKDDEKKEDGEPGLLDKTTEGAKGLLNKVNPANLLK